MDEVFDSSLDGFGTDEFLKIIRFVIKDANIFVISHKGGLEDKFESVISFTKDKGFSSYDPRYSNRTMTTPNWQHHSKKDRNENLNPRKRQAKAGDKPF